MSPKSVNVRSTISNH